MGLFSWIYSDTNKNLVWGKNADAYLLVPPPFQKKYGKYILEKCYDGYGDFGNYDIYTLIPEWNKEFIPEICKRIEEGNWECDVSKRDLTLLQDYYSGKKLDEEQIRDIGIIMACYDEDNMAIPYPIKIVSCPMEYDEASPSLKDPEQGYESSGDAEC